MEYHEKLETAQLVNAPTASVVQWLEDNALDKTPGKMLLVSLVWLKPQMKTDNWEPPNGDSEGHLCE